MRLTWFLSLSERLANRRLLGVRRTMEQVQEAVVLWSFGRKQGGHGGTWHAARGTTALSVSSTTRSFPNTKSDRGLASSSHLRHSKSVPTDNALGFVPHGQIFTEEDSYRLKTWSAPHTTFASSCRSLPPRMVFFLFFSFLLLFLLSDSLYVILAFCVFCQYADYSHPCSRYCVWASMMKWWALSIDILSLPPIVTGRERKREERSWCKTSMRNLVVLDCYLFNISTFNMLLQFLPQLSVSSVQVIKTSSDMERKTQAQTDRFL